MKRFLFIVAAVAFAGGCQGEDVAKQAPDDTASANANVDPTPASDSDALKSESTPAPVATSPTDAVVDFSLRLLSWNVESGGSEPEVIARELAEMGDYDVVALTEVLPGASELFRDAVGEQFESITGRSGRDDRMMLIYNRNTLELVRKFEIEKINFKQRYRSPLVAHFRDKLTGSEILVVVNHLARGKAKVRQTQAKQLVEWARQETFPIIAVGDYNFDYVFETRKGNEAFRLFMKDNVFKWIEPVELIDTNWYDNPQDPDGKDDYPGSMLDFAFVANAAAQWHSSCKVIVREGDFPDTDKTSDHRPFELIVSAR